MENARSKKWHTIFAALTAVVSLPLLLVFEAHVINVRAAIVNGVLAVPDEMSFGTVFPHDSIDRSFTVSLSESFLNDPERDTVRYVLRQKPKCGLPVLGTSPLEYSDFGQTIQENRDFECADEGYLMLPLLCPYLSKHEIETPEETGGDNDGPGVNAYHGDPDNWDLAMATSTDSVVFGLLSKSSLDASDSWVMDLRVPCFKINCGQEWVELDLYKADPALISEMFGCDVWMEVLDIE